MVYVVNKLKLLHVHHLISYGDNLFDLIIFVNLVDFNLADFFGSLWRTADFWGILDRWLFAK